MADKARTWTDKKLKQMEKKISDIYKDAEAGITKNWNAYMEESASVLAEYQKAYDDAKKSGDKDLIRTTGKKLANMKKEQTLMNDGYKEMVEVTTEQIANVNQTALAYANDQIPSIYAKNYAQVGDDLAAFDVTFQGLHGGESIRKIVNEDVVKNMITDGTVDTPFMHTKKFLNIPKDIRWNTKKINSSVLQGILQGESMDKIAARLLPIVHNNEAAAIRNTRTLVTGAENRGRQDSYERLSDEGIVMKKVWIATPDDRTREWHLDMDGQKVEVDEPFIDGNGNKLRFPGDPTAAPETVYNCRCGMKSKPIGFRRTDGSISYIDFEGEESAHDKAISTEQKRRVEEVNGKNDRGKNNR